MSAIRGLVQLTSELAGMGGNIGYLKNEIFFQDNFSLFEDIVSVFLLDQQSKHLNCPKSIISTELNLRCFNSASCQAI